MKLFKRVIRLYTVVLCILTLPYLSAFVGSQSYDKKNLISTFMNPDPGSYHDVGDERMGYIITLCYTASTKLPYHFPSIVSGVSLAHHLPTLMVPTQASPPIYIALIMYDNKEAETSKELAQNFTLFTGLIAHPSCEKNRQ